MNADRIAAVYRWIEYLAFGRALERCRRAQLDRVPPDSRILILGEGDGRFLSRLLPRLSSDASVDVVEASESMVRLAKRRIEDQTKTPVYFLFHSADQMIASDADYDVIVTNFFLDCLTQREAAQLVEKLSHAMKPGGLWIVGEFHIPERGLRHWHARLWVWTMYLFFRLTTGLMVREIPDYRCLFGAAQFVQLSVQEQRFGLIRSELWQKPQ